MSITSKVSFAVRCSLPLAGLFLTDCYVQSRGTVGTAPINVQASTQTTATATMGTAQTTTYVAPTQTTTYVAPAYTAPPAVVGGGWITEGYAETDYVSYNMSLRARQFAAGYYPVTQLYRASMYQGQHQFVTVAASPGRCYRIIGVGGPGVQDLDLRLRDMAGNVVDQDVATDNFPVLGLQRPLCLNWQGTFQIEIIMYSGGGQIGVQAFATN